MSETSEIKHVIFKVDEKLFVCHREILLKVPDTYFAKCISPQWDTRKSFDQPIEPGKCSKHLQFILDYLRDGECNLKALSSDDLRCLADDAGYFLLTDLYRGCRSESKKREKLAYNSITTVKVFVDHETCMNIEARTQGFYAFLNLYKLSWSDWPSLDDLTKECWPMEVFYIYDKEYGEITTFRDGKVLKSLMNSSGYLSKRVACKTIIDEALALKCKVECSQGTTSISGQWNIALYSMFHIVSLLLSSYHAT